MQASAWDAVGHRLSVAVALEYVTDGTRAKLLDILSHHPRYAADFTDSMPGSIARGSQAARDEWLLGQAAYWPDIARSLPDAEAARYNRPTWHYIDGAWVRDAAARQGNTYVGISPFPDILGPSAATITRQAQADNVMTALDYNSRVLADASRAAADRAIALCWVLHLVGDIHQPLHTGSLFSADLFDNGDRGGNGVRTNGGNLHSRWDQALRATGIGANLEAIVANQQALTPPRLADITLEWSLWMSESRALLEDVYTPSILAAIARAERRGTSLAPVVLDADYVTRMERLSRDRIALAGLRLAAWFETRLP